MPNAVSPFIILRGFFDLPNRFANQSNDRIKNKIWVVSKLLRGNYSIPEVLQIISRTISVFQLIIAY